MNEETLFAEALKRTDRAERAAFLEQACGHDVALRGRVEALLRSHEQAGSFLNQPDAGVTREEVPGQWLDQDQLPETSLESVGSRIKQYKLLQQIGEGGMGVVFMAEQQEPVRRMVALKVIKAGMDSAQIIARFEQERQALALMDHPNIAKVLDAGTTASGRPFFVMELVKGIPITKYCDEQRLSPKQRLELFVPVCQAIQHAHQKGIIHRDIKPSNVLIAAYDGKPVPKVIDFGVAKATGQKLTERTLFTGFGGLVGTLEYMSPEQAEFNAWDIDTRSDIYCLGVLLYELLTGTTPLSRRRIKDAAIMEVLRLIREEEPPRPSTRLSESKDSLASVSAQRQSEPAALVKSMRGEVDWIVMKALEKDRTRRYETANGLARDIQRYLAEEPVEAGPPSARYRLRKLAWKHRRSLTTAAALLLLLIAAVVVSSGLALWAVKERDRATEAETEAKGQRDKAVEAEKAAQRSEEDTKAVLEYFQDKLLSAGRPEGQEGGLGPDVKLREAVEQAGKKIADNLAEVYLSVGRVAEAIQLHEKTLKQIEAKLGPDHLYTLTSRKNLAVAYDRAGRIAEAKRHHREVLIQTRNRFGKEASPTAAQLDLLADNLLHQHKYTDAEPMLRDCLKLREAKQPDAWNTFHTQSLLGGALLGQKKYADAEPLLLKGYQGMKRREAKIPPQDKHRLREALERLVQVYEATGKKDEAARWRSQLQSARPSAEKKR